jgi:hypothetical protein
MNEMPEARSFRAPDVKSGVFERGENHHVQFTPRGEKKQLNFRDTSSIRTGSTATEYGNVIAHS